jgi:hypothetical protein
MKSQFVELRESCKGIALEITGGLIMVCRKHVSEQSWHGLAVRQDDRYRLAATPEGGIWLMRTPHPDPVVALAGHRPATESTRRLAGWLRWQGTSRLGQQAVANPVRPVRSPQ